MKESIHMFNWENLWSDIKKHICIIIVVVVAVGVLTYFVYPKILQVLIDVTLSYFEKLRTF